jgi:predicted acetyltransferase
MLIRQVKPEELEEYYQGDRYAYVDGSGQESDPGWLTAIATNQVWAVFIDGKMTSGLTLWHFEQVVRGSIKVMGGIAGVWSYPEFRDRGYVRALLEEVLAQMPQLGISVSMLLPFKQSFYQKFGYVAANANLRLTIPLACLVHHLGLSSENWQVERISTLEVREVIQAFLKELCKGDRWHGQVLANLDRANWQLRYREDLSVMLRKDDRIKAIAIYTIDSQKDLAIQVKEIYWTDNAARDRLFRFFASHRDRIQNLTLEVPLGENFYAWLQDLPNSIYLNLNPQPWMVQVTDVLQAINGIKASFVGRIVIAVRENNLDTEIRLAIAGNGQELSATKTQAPWQVWLDLQGLTALVYGTSELQELMETQLIKFAPATSDLEIYRVTLENWFPPLLIYNSFYY